MNWVWMAIGIVLLVVGAELLVRGASQLALLFKISPLVIGLTVVAFGTSAPELAVSVASALKGDASIAIGNVVGSNIFNVLFILGISAVIVPLSVMQQLIRFDVPLMIAISVLVWWMASSGGIDRGEGSFLVFGLVSYTVWSIRQSRKESAEVQAEYAQEYSPTSVPEKQGKTVFLLTRVLLVLIGLGILIAGSQLLVVGAVGLATSFGISSAVIGLTIVAAGTSLPEVATSVIAAWKGEKDIAVGNVIGSNLFNLLGVLGCASLVSPAGLPVSSGFIGFDIPVMLLVAIVCLPILISGWEISRWEGAVLVTCYIAYTTVVVMVETDHPSAPLPRNVLVYGAVPLAALLSAIGIGQWRIASNRKTG